MELKNRGKVIQITSELDIIEMLQYELSKHSVVKIEADDGKLILQIGSGINDSNDYSYECNKLIDYIKKDLERRNKYLIIELLKL